MKCSICRHEGCERGNHRLSARIVANHDKIAAKEGVLRKTPAERYRIAARKRKRTMERKRLEREKAAVQQLALVKLCQRN